LLRQRDALQTQFAELAQTISVFGSDAETLGQLDEIRCELALVERDLSM
jgi:hypothetical protein